MKLFGIILIASVSLLTAQADEDVKAAEATNVVVISTDYINRLVGEARTNNPSLKAADARVRSATLNAGAVRTWEDPMAMFGGSVYSSPGFNPSEDGNLAYGDAEGNAGLYQECRDGASGSSPRLPSRSRSATSQKVRYAPRAGAWDHFPVKPVFAKQATAR